jgi:uncharacterized protein
VELEHSFSVPVAINEAWTMLLDLERVGGWLPGATVESVSGPTASGALKIKLGPLNLNYRGTASVVEQDELAHRAVLNAKGEDARNGTASATVVATLKDEGETTTVQLNTDLDLTGKPAQFARAVMVDVGGKLLARFADALAAELGTGSTPPGAPADPTPPVDQPEAAKVAPEPDDVPPAAAPRPPAPVTSRATPAAAVDPEPVELIKAAGPALGKKLAGPAAVALVVMLIAARRRRQG